MSNPLFSILRSALTLGLLTPLAFGCSDGGSPMMSTDMGTDLPPPPRCEDIERDLDIPFDYTLEADHLAVTSASGNIAHVLIGPWGAHTQPHTGHAEGNVKADWAALFAVDRTDPLVVQLSFDGDLQQTGSCAVGQVCAVAATDVYARLVDYQLPAEARVTRVEKYNGVEFEVEVELCPYRYTFGHVGAISSAVIDLMVDAGYADPSGDIPLSQNLITGDPVEVPANTPLARPSLVSTGIVGNATYMTGRDTVPHVPWQDIEWTAIHMGDSQDNVARPEYDYVAPSVRTALEGILVAQAERVDNFRYNNLSHVEDWLYRAEHVLVATPPFPRAPQTTLTGGVGGWYEQPEDGAACAPQEDDACNDLFSIFRVHQDGELYDASLYASPDVAWLVYRREQQGMANVFERFGEVLTPSDPDDHEGELVIHWRSVGPEQYQRASYRIDDQGRMRIRYGARVDAVDFTTVADLPALTPLDGSESCADADVFCYSGVAYGRF